MGGVVSAVHQGKRWPSTCNRCGREAEVGSREDYGMQVVCDACATGGVPRRGTTPTGVVLDLSLGTGQHGESNTAPLAHRNTPSLAHDAQAAGQDEREREQRFRAGTLRPVVVRHRPLPDDASRRTRAALAYFCQRVGLRLADGEDRPLPFARNELVRARIVDHLEQASRELRRLVRWGVLEEDEPLAPRKGVAYRRKTFRLAGACAPLVGGCAGTTRGRSGSPAVVAPQRVRACTADVVRNRHAGYAGVGASVRPMPDTHATRGNVPRAGTRDCFVGGCDQPVQARGNDACLLHADLLAVFHVAARRRRRQPAQLRRRPRPLDAPAPAAWARGVAATAAGHASWKGRPARR